MVSSWIHVQKLVFFAVYFLNIAFSKSLLLLHCFFFKFYSEFIFHLVFNTFIYVSDFSLFEEISLLNSKHTKVKLCTNVHLLNWFYKYK